MKKRKFGLKNIIYLILTMIVIWGFMIFTKTDQLARCAIIGFSSDFIEVEHHVFVPYDMHQSQIDIVLGYVEISRKRNVDFFGQLMADPVIIFTNSEEVATKYRGNNIGATHHSLWGLYVVIGPGGYSSDIISHELAHSELCHRVGWFKANRLPIWFNEGVATQLDYSPAYSGGIWNQITDNGENIRDVKVLDKANEFYASSHKERLDNYVLAKHEIEVWMEVVGIEGLLEVIQRYKNGDDLYEEYLDVLLEHRK